MPHYYAGERLKRFMTSLHPIRIHYYKYIERLFIPYIYII